MNFLDRDEQLQGDFFSTAEAISDVADTQPSQFDLDDEEHSGPTVTVRFNSEGFAEEVSDDTTDGTKTGKRVKEAASEPPLEPMPLPGKLGVTQFGQDFAEIHARAQELREVSKLSTCRWQHHGTGKKISNAPCVMDFLADVQITARRVLSPALYKIWHETYYEGVGENSDDLPVATQVTIMQRCSAAWKTAGILPWVSYWHQPTPENKLGTAVDLLEAIEEEQRISARKQRRNKLRRARGRQKVSTLAAVAA